MLCGEHDEQIVLHYPGLMKSIIVSASLLILLALVVLSNAALSGGEGDGSIGKPRFIPELSQGGFFAIAGLLLGGLVISMVAAFAHLVKTKAFENIRLKGPNWGIVSLLLRLALIFLIVYFLAALILSLLSFDEEEEGKRMLPGTGDVQEEVLEEEFSAPEDEPVRTVENGPRRSFTAALIVVAAASMLFFGYRYYRSLSRTPPQEMDAVQEEMRRDLMSASLKSLEQLLATPDHRQAIIAAYAIMEESFARYGHKRKAHQTPIEYMTATIQEVSRRGGLLPETSLLRLTHLYETAKFSDHEILESHRQDAVDLLREIQHSLSTRN